MNMAILSRVMMAIWYIIACQILWKVIIVSWVMSGDYMNLIIQYIFVVIVGLSNIGMSNSLL